MTTYRENGGSAYDDEWMEKRFDCRPSAELTQDAALPGEDAIKWSIVGASWEHRALRAHTTHHLESALR